MDQGLLENNIFALYISKKEESTTSRFWQGGYNPEYINQDEGVIYHDVVNKTYWTLKLDKVQINGIDSELCNTNPEDTSKSCMIIMDSGTSSLAAPSSMYHPLDSLLKVHGNSSSIESWPEITLVMSGYDYKMPPESYTYRNGYAVDETTTKPGDIIESAWQGFDSGYPGENIWIAGDSFLRQYITIYDRDNDTVGIAKPDHERIQRVQAEEAPSHLRSNIEQLL